ncbi:hypothetical protein DXG03_002508, partial [Asterophora parasitica]
LAMKRTLELAVTDGEQALVNDDHEPPAKRRMTSAPHTPLPSRHSFPTHQTPFTAGTPYPSRPLDSPTNPLGRKRTQVLAHSLPAPTSFSKHLPLRFQFVRPGVSPRMGGIYRVVQVPLSYTFIQLRCLIAFLFGGGYADEREDRHLFEFQKKIVIYAQTYRPGQIRSGYTAVKLSSARDPCRYRPEVDEDSLCDDESSKPEGGEDFAADDTDEGEGEDPGWTWELEEEYTLGHAWSRGGDLTRGIIYVRLTFSIAVGLANHLSLIQHHNETTAVHITLNTTALPRRSGHSNTPYVFQARGRVRLFPNSVLPLPRPLFSIPVGKLPAPSFRNSAWSTTSPEDAEDEDDDSNPPYDDMSSSGLFGSQDAVQVGEMSDSDNDEGDVKEEAEDPNVMLPTDKFNRAKAFAAYLRFVHQHSTRLQYPTSDDSDSDDVHENAPVSTPGLVHWGSSPISSSSFPSSSSSAGIASSPFIVSSPNHSRSLAYDPYTACLPMLSATAFTPAPPHALWQRRRLERVQKRMENSKKREWMRNVNDNEEDGEDQLCDKSKPPLQPAVQVQKRVVPMKLPPRRWVKSRLPEEEEIENTFQEEIEV